MSVRRIVSKTMLVAAVVTAAGAACIARAGQWQPVCVEGSTCRHTGRVIDASGPLTTQGGLWLQHNPVADPTDQGKLFELDADGGGATRSR